MMTTNNKFLISKVAARRVLDSRGKPTVEVDVITEAGIVGRAIAPSGASKSSYEAIDLRDRSRAFRGFDVTRAISNVNKIIAPAITGLDSRKQTLVDRKICTLDGTPNKSRLGTNATTATSIAVAKAAANTLGLPLYKYLGGAGGTIVLPVPLMNVINGGVHAGNELSFQEFLIAPVGADSFSEAVKIGVEVYYCLRDILIEKYGKSAINVGDEGGFAPPLRENVEALHILDRAIKVAGYSESDVYIGLDVAASQLFDKDQKVYRVDDRFYDSNELLEYYYSLIDEFNIRSIEDPFEEDDYRAFAEFTNRVGSRVLVIGDDLYASNVIRLIQGIESNSTNAAILKINQIGTITEAIDFARSAHRVGMKIIVSHRSGETEDNAISHIAVALRAGFIKAGAPARGERVAKYNELLRIEEEEDTLYPGALAYKQYVYLSSSYYNW